MLLLLPMCAHSLSLSSLTQTQTARLLAHHSTLPKDEQLRLRLVQGIPQPLTQVRLVDDEGKLVPKDNRTVGNIQGILL